MRAWLIRLYPRAWRERYGDEFAALLAHYPLTPLVVLDVLRGALDAHTSVHAVEQASIDRHEHQRAVRRKAVLLGGILFAGGWLLRWLGSAPTHRPHVVHAAWTSLVYVGIVAALLYGVPAVRRVLVRRRAVQR